MPCYLEIDCNRCLDWREICDGKIDCLGNGIDEADCLDLEMNQCEDNEYRCHNGLCIAEEFLNDNPIYPDCLDGTDERGERGLQIRLSPGLDCFRDPSFRCEESNILDRSKTYPCGDGQVSRIFTLSCNNARDQLYLQELFAVSQNPHLSEACWLALYCARTFGSRRTNRCTTFCQGLFCQHNLKESCSMQMAFFPGNILLHDHIRFAYFTNQTIIRRRTEVQSLPDYICYSLERCPFLKFSFHYNGSVCASLLDLSVKSLLEIDLLFRTCPSNSSTVNRTDLAWKTLFQCPTTEKFIAKFRLMDGTIDCYEHVDEKNIDTCSLMQKDRFECSSEKKCLWPINVYDGIYDCLLGEDEKLVPKTLLDFDRMCDGLRHLSPDSDHGQNETDETNCEQWPCNNRYTRCDGFWSCLNGEDELGCPSSSPCFNGTFPCMQAPNWSFTCLSRSRINDGIIDCLGSADERSYCRSHGIIAHNLYRCWNDTQCVWVGDACNSKACPDDIIYSQCNKKEFIYSFESISNDTGRLMEDRKKSDRCVCQKTWSGTECEKTGQLEMVFSQVPTPQVFLAHLITAPGDGEPERLSIAVRMRWDRDELS
ncbi:unnamed protein product [Adineta steineri]|uniref:Uncharacterized protein n=1 Tax=Adineta steineri TaxID=433720 RepID=A0A815JTX9_9BILA|nr:unnamed protein product [Adineta steineri]CAF1609572.1 unnamed protein product [Adineta steineri]